MQSSLPCVVITVCATIATQMWLFVKPMRAWCRRRRTRQRHEAIQVDGPAQADVDANAAEQVIAPMAV